MTRKALILLLAALMGLVPVAAGAAEIVTHKNLAYADRSERNVLDLYLPAGLENPPLVMWIHGGGWEEGSKDYPVGLKRLLDAGIGVAAMNYRFCPDAVWPAQFEDLGDAFAYLRGHGADYGYDAARLAVFGHSAGGHLAAVAGIALSADPATRLVAAVVYAGPSDFGKNTEDSVAFNTASGRSLSPSTGASYAEACLIGGVVADHADLAWRASPLSYLADLEPGTPLPSFLILQGARDYTVNPFQSGRLFDALLARAPDTEIEFILIRGGKHEGPTMEGAAVMSRVVDFLARSFAQ